MVHLARSTPPSLVTEALDIFDLDIRRCFTEYTSIDVSNVAWQQAQLSPIIALGESHHFEQSIDNFSLFIADSEATCVQDIIDAPPHQTDLSSKIEDISPIFYLTFLHHQPTWLSFSLYFIPTLSLAFGHANAPDELIHVIRPPEFQAGLNWWLGMDTSQNSCCSFCPTHVFDPLGHPPCR
ncbi:hypothetical protein EMCRGX_G013347 [Ephydatia muelleri]